MNCFRIAVGMLVLSVAGAGAAGEPWRYVVPEPGQEHEHPPLQMLPLASQKPADLREKVEYRGARQRYAQLRYGSSGAPPVAVVVDEISRGQVDLYIDRNRNRIIEPDERLEPQDGTWRTQLDAILLDDGSQQVLPRSVIFHMGRTGITLSFATLGYFEGQVDIDGRTIMARRQDADANGLLGDARDRIWLDLDGDGQWDPLREQFLENAILRIGDARYAVTADRAGKHLALSPLVGVGALRLAVQPFDSQAEIVEVTVTLGGRDGSAVSLTGGERFEVPAGEYRLSSLKLSLRRPPDSVKWTFVFDELGGRVHDAQGRMVRRWYRVEDGETVDIDPIGRLELVAQPRRESCLPGEQLTIQPLLYTEEGLLITTCYRGERQDTGETTLTMSLVSPGGSLLETTSTGFA